ncbi:MAG: WD40 repeat domain-containing protein, partial [Actinomycetota bacterium]
MGQIAGYIGDGRLVTIGPDGFTLTDMDTGRTETWEPEAMPPVSFADPSPTNQNLLLSTEDGLLVWEFGAKEPIDRIDHQLPSAPIGVFLDDGERYLLLGQDDEVIIRSTVDDTSIGLRGHPGFVTGIGLSADGAILGVATVTGELLVWDLTPSGPGELGNVSVRGLVSDIRVGSDQGWIAIADSAGIRFVDQQTGEVVADLNYGTGGIDGGWPAGADQLMAAASTDEGQVLVVDLPSSETVFEVLVCDNVDAIDDRARWLYL